MVDNWIKKIKDILKEGVPHFQEEIRAKLGKPDRAILTGYLRCLSDLGEIESKDRGRAKIYFIKKRGKENEKNN